MNPTENITGKKLTDLGVTQPDQLTPLFAQIRFRFDTDAAPAHGEASWKLLRDAWLGRKSGVLTQITDNWLKPAPPDLKRAVGASLNELRAHVESKIEELRASIESGADSATSARERIDLSLPGVIRPVRDARGRCVPCAPSEV